MKKYDYAVIRHGSNSANQSMVDEMAIDVISAKNRTEAEVELRNRVDEGKYDFYANQWSEIVLLSSLSKSERNDLLDTVFLDNELVECCCVVCGTPMGKTERWRANNMYCGCEG